MIFTLCLDVKIVPWEWTARRTSRRAIVAHIGVALRLPIPIVFIVCLALTAFICSLAHEGRTMLLANSSVAVVASQRRGNHHHGWWRSLKGESPFPCMSYGGFHFSPCWRKEQSKRPGIRPGMNKNNNMAPNF